MEELDVVKELSKKYNRKEKLILIMLEECKSFGYNINKSRDILIGFME